MRVLEKQWPHQVSQKVSGDARIRERICSALISLVAVDVGIVSKEVTRLPMRL